jgi:hypothetical protein
MTNPSGRHKAIGFERILDIGIDDIDYLEAVIRIAIVTAPVMATRDRAPYGINAVVEIPVRGLRWKRNRVVRVRTVWRLAGPGYPPQLTTAFPRP